MQRKREQKGTVVRIGGFWCCRYADFRIENDTRIPQAKPDQKTDGRPRRARATPPKYVTKLQQEFMGLVNASSLIPEACSTIAQFVESNWLPFVQEQRSSSTVTTYKFYWTHLPNFFIRERPCDKQAG